jgi:hypothetical protein
MLIGCPLPGAAIDLLAWKTVATLRNNQNMD